MSIKELYKRFFVIHQCGGCRQILDHEFAYDALCPECRLRWNIAKTESCPICAQSAVECTCMPKVLARSGALTLRKLYFYSDQKEKEPQNKLLYFIKKNPNKRMADFIASELMGQMREELEVLGVEPKDVLLVSIPRGHRSKRIYGFDQSEFICKRLSLLTGTPYLPLLKRRHGGKEQKQLDRKQRLKNMEKLLYIKDSSAAEGKYIILFDDVVTTGAGMSASTAILKKAGAKGVICQCIAQVPEKGKKQTSLK